MSKETIIERIKKLLALSQSPNEHEAQLAAQKARELQQQHNIEVSDLAATTGNVDINEDWIEIGKCATFEHLCIFQILREFFNVEVFTQKSVHFGPITAVLIGERSNVEFARHIYTFLKSEIGRNFLAYQKTQTGRNEGLRRSWVRGFYHGLCQKLKLASVQPATENQQRGLVIVDKAVQTYIQEKHPEVKVHKVKARVGQAGAYHAGVETGSNTSIRKAVA